MNINSFITKDYRKKDDFEVRINKPNSNPISIKAKMNVNLYVIEDYENETAFRPKKTNPIKACPERIEFTLSVIEGNGPILKRMNVNFCAKGYYKSKPKAVEKPPLVEFTIFRVSGHQEKIDLA